MHHTSERIAPWDSYNQALVANVHPPQWINPTPTDAYHLVVLGAGTAGLVTAAGAAGMGARVALVERELMGGDCLNVGCVPSKAVIRTARVAAAMREAEELGVHVPPGVQVDFSRAMQRMRRLRAAISPHDSADRFRSLGVDVYFGQAAFLDRHTVQVKAEDDSVRQLPFKKAVIATGARAAAPGIPGLDSVPYLTNETLFSLTEKPDRLGVIGSGPIGCEMAQTFARFGVEVHLFEQADRILTREDPEAAAILQQQLEKDGVRLRLTCHDMRLSPATDGGIQVRVVQQGQEHVTVVDQLLVAVGRAANTDGLNLEAAGVGYDRHGVHVNDYLRTSNKNIYAAGDVCSRYKFTHAADFQARLVIQNSLFAIGPFGRRKASRLLTPWATYTSPEVAHVGLYEHEARQAGVAIDTYVQPLANVDRAILESQVAGFVKVHTRRGTDKILGATIVAENAGDMISEITLAMNYGLGLSKIGSSIHPYPTQAEAIRKLGDQYNRTRLTPAARRVLNWLRWWNVGG